MMMVKSRARCPPCTARAGQGNAYPRHGYNTDSTSMLLLTPERPMWGHDLSAKLGLPVTLQLPGPSANCRRIYRPSPPRLNVAGCSHHATQLASWQAGERPKARDQRRPVTGEHGGRVAQNRAASVTLHCGASGRLATPHIEQQDHVRTSRLRTRPQISWRFAVSKEERSQLLPSSTSGDNCHWLTRWLRCRGGHASSPTAHVASPSPPRRVPCRRSEAPDARTQETAREPT
jgi:hypothetical protein